MGNTELLKKINRTKIQKALFWNVKQCLLHAKTGSFEMQDNLACLSVYIFIRNRRCGSTLTYNTKGLMPTRPLRGERRLLPTKYLPFHHTRTRLVE